MKKLLVTGGAGFIGSHFIAHILKNDFQVVNLDALTYAASPENLKDAENNPHYSFVKGDIGDQTLAENLFTQHAFSGVIHLAAESHVDNSIAGPEAFMRTNVMGTFTLLEAARRAWMKAPFIPKEGCENFRFLQVSTDEVYGSLGQSGYFSEATPYAPNSPYSASKAAADMLVRSYFHTYGMNVVTTNCSNNYGPHQHSEKLIPTIIRTALGGKPIPIYGDGKNIRDWLYVTDHCRGLELAFTKGKAGETYAIGGRNEHTNLEITALICRYLDELKPRPDKRRYNEQITFVKDRAGHDRRYAIDAGKIEKMLGWKANTSFEEGLRKTVEWYLEKYSEEAFFI